MRYVIDQKLVTSQEDPVLGSFYARDSLTSQTAIFSFFSRPQTKEKIAVWLARLCVRWLKVIAQSVLP